MDVRVIHIKFLLFCTLSMVLDICCSVVLGMLAEKPPHLGNFTCPEDQFFGNHLEEFFSRGITLSRQFWILIVTKLMLCHNVLNALVGAYDTAGLHCVYGFLSLSFTIVYQAWNWFSKEVLIDILIYTLDKRRVMCQNIPSHIDGNIGWFVLCFFFLALDLILFAYLWKIVMLYPPHFPFLDDVIMNQGPELNRAVEEHPPPYDLAINMEIMRPPQYDQVNQNEATETRHRGNNRGGDRRPLNN